MNGSTMFDLMREHINQSAPGTQTLERVSNGPGLVKVVEGEFIAKKPDVIVAYFDSFSDMQPEPEVIDGQRDCLRIGVDKKRVRNRRRA